MSFRRVLFNVSVLLLFALAIGFSWGRHTVANKNGAYEVVRDQNTNHVLVRRVTDGVLVGEFDLLTPPESVAVVKEDLGTDLCEAIVIVVFPDRTLVYIGVRQGKEPLPLIIPPSGGATIPQKPIDNPII
jgi:hypothetical protein